MRYLLIILSLVSISLCQLLPSDEDIAQMSPYEKQMLFDRYDKNPYWNTYINLSVPVFGYARINDWERGIKFLKYELLLATVGLSVTGLGMHRNVKENDSSYEFHTIEYLGWSILGCAGALHLYTIVDLFKQTNKYNEQLHNKIFQKDKKLSYLLLPTSNGAYLNLSYKF